MGTVVGFNGIYGSGLFFYFYQRLTVLLSVKYMHVAKQAYISPSHSLYANLILKIVMSTFVFVK